MLKSKFRSLDEIEILETNNILGKGAFSQVQKVIMKETKKMYALKTVDLKNLSKSDQENLKYEAKIHESINFENIIKFENCLQINNKVYFLLELAENGSLFYYIDSRKGIPEKVALRFFLQISKAVYHLHQKNICHRDIKPENILIDSRFNAKLADFGWSCFLENGEVRTSICGTLEYMSPELVINHCHTNKIDIWALGILLYELLHGEPPFKVSNFSDLEIFFKNNNKISFKKGISSLCEDLLNNLLLFDEVERFSIEQVIHHKVFFNFDYDRKLLSENDFQTLVQNYFVNTKNKHNLIKPIFMKNKYEELLSDQLKNSIDNSKLPESTTPSYIFNFSETPLNNYKNNLSKITDENFQKDKLNIKEIFASRKRITLEKFDFKLTLQNQMEIISDKKIKKEENDTNLCDINNSTTKNKINNPAEIINQDDHFLLLENLYINSKENCLIKDDIKLKNLRFYYNNSNNQENKIGEKKHISKNSPINKNKNIFSLNQTLTINLKGKSKDKKTEFKKFDFENNNFESKLKKNELFKISESNLEMKNSFFSVICENESLKFSELNSENKKMLYQNTGQQKVSNKSNLSFLTKNKMRRSCVNSDNDHNQTTIVSKFSTSSLKSNKSRSYFDSFKSFRDSQSWINFVDKEKLFVDDSKSKYDKILASFLLEKNDEVKINPKNTNQFLEKFNFLNEEVLDQRVTVVKSNCNNFSKRKKIIKLDNYVNSKDLGKYHF